MYRDLEVGEEARILEPPWSDCFCGVSGDSSTETLAAVRARREGRTFVATANGGWRVQTGAGSRGWRRERAVGAANAAVAMMRKMWGRGRGGGLGEGCGWGRCKVGECGARGGAP